MTLFFSTQEDFIKMYLWDAHLCEEVGIIYIYDKIPVQLRRLQGIQQKPNEILNAMTPFFILHKYFVNDCNHPI